MQTYLNNFGTNSTDLILYPCKELKLYLYRTESIVVTKKLQVELTKTSLQEFHIKMDCVVNEICVWTIYWDST